MVRREISLWTYFPLTGELDPTKDFYLTIKGILSLSIHFLTLMIQSFQTIKSTINKKGNSAPSTVEIVLHMLAKDLQCCHFKPHYHLKSPVSLNKFFQNTIKLSGWFTDMKWSQRLACLLPATFGTRVELSTIPYFTESP